MTADESAQMTALSYEYKNSLYLNITPRCPTACTFCIKFSWNYLYRGYNLLLKKEPSVQEILATVENPAQYDQIVFCGYGESTYRLDAMREIAGELKKRGARHLRLNTIGLGNLINKRNIAPDLAGFLDSICISLNTLDPAKWAEIHRPLPEFREKGFDGVVEFIRECAKVMPETYVTAVEMTGLEKEQFEQFVKKLGAKVRFRPYLDGYESS